jgi:ABC-2 type transport system permease protein
MSSILIAQIIKEFLSILRDSKTRIILIGPPLAQLFIFSYAITLEVNNATIAIFNQDTGSYSQSYIDKLSHSYMVKKIIPIYSQQELQSTLDQRKAILSITIPDNFSAQLAQKKLPLLQMIADGRRANAAQIAMAYIQQISNQFIAEKESNTAMISPIIERHWFNPNLSYQWYVVPSLSGVLAMIIALLLTGLSIARERELGTFDQLLVSPTTNGEIILAKILPPIVIGMVLGNLMITAGVVIFSVPFVGSLFLLEIALFAFMLSISAVGLCFSAISNTQQQAILGCFALAVPLILLSGFATPITNMPEFLQHIANWVPLTHYIIIVQGTFLKALPTNIIIEHLIPMIIVAIISLTAATYLVRSKLQ